MCIHKLVHLEVEKNEKRFGETPQDRWWKRKDTFYCQKCGEIIVKEKSLMANYRPKWY